MKQPRPRVGSIHIIDDNDKKKKFLKKNNYLNELANLLDLKFIEL